MSVNAVRLIGGLALDCVIGLVGFVNENLASVVKYGVGLGNENRAAVVKSGERKSSALKHRDHKAKGSEVPSAVYPDVGKVKKWRTSQGRQYDSSNPMPEEEPEPSPCCQDGILKSRCLRDQPY